MIANPPASINRVFVTGATGLVGRALVDELIISGLHVSAMDRDPLHSRLPSGINGVHSDLQHISTAAAAEIADCDAVIHAAAQTPQIGVPVSEYREVNIEGTERIIDQCTKANKRLIYVSSVNVELFRTGRARDAYSESKSAAEYLVNNAVASGLDGVIVRPSYVFGNVRGHAGKLVDRILEDRISLLPASDRKISPVFVGDLARAIRLAAMGALSGSIHTIAGKCSTLKEFVNKICDLLGQPRPLITIPIWLAAVPLAVLWKLESVTRWTPPMTLDSLRTSSVFDGQISAQQLGFEYSPLEGLFSKSKSDSSFELVKLDS